MSSGGNITIHAFIRRLRTEAGYAQLEIAKALCISRSAYSYKELGRIPFYPEELLLLAKKFELKPDIFFEPELWNCEILNLREMKFGTPNLFHLGKLTTAEIEIIEEYRRREFHD